MVIWSGQRIQTHLLVCSCSPVGEGEEGLGKNQGSRVLFHYSMEADLPPTERPSAENNHFFSFFPVFGLCPLAPAAEISWGGITEGKLLYRYSDVGTGKVAFLIWQSLGLVTDCLDLM